MKFKIGDRLYSTLVGAGQIGTVISIEDEGVVIQWDNYSNPVWVEENTLIHYRDPIFLCTK